MRTSALSTLASIILLFLFFTGLTGQDLFVPENISDKFGSEYTDINPVLSVDGKTLFFSRINHPENRHGGKDSQDIWYLTLREDGTWSSPERLPDDVNIGRYNAILAALEDGRSYLILGQFNRTGTARTRNGYSLIEKAPDGNWSVPRPVDVSRYNRMSRGRVSSAYMTSDREVIIHSFSKRHNRSRLSLYYSTRNHDNTYTRPRELKIDRYNGTKLRSLEAPFMTARKERLYFSANTAGDPGNYNIYYVERNDETFTNWSPPVKLNDTINSSPWVSYFRMNDDESRAWYSSAAGPNERADIITIKLFERNPFVHLRGVLLNAATGQPVAAARNPEILVNGEHSDSVVYNYRTGSFYAYLPLGESYTITGRADNFSSGSVIVDVSSEQSFVEREIEFHLKSVPWVELTGQVLDNRSMTPLGSEAGPVFMINGEMADSVYIDPVDGSFSIKLPFGKNYIIGVAADRYRTIDVKVDLTTHDQHTVIRQDILAERIGANLVTLKGNMVNTKTGKFLEEGYDVRMIVNGRESPAFEYNHSDASYNLSLPVGFNYDLIPKLVNFYNRLEAVDLTDAEPMSVIDRNFYVTPLEVGQSIEIENIYFETGSSVLKPESFRSLNALIGFLKEYPNVVVEIGGHTDNVGSATLNEALSEGRAFAVAEYVISQGINAQRVVSKGYGFSKPVASNQTEEGRNRNRRVDFTILGL
jgi:outer membrane protein OmpA-like peptidoglycan-associated protein